MIRALRIARVSLTTAALDLAEAFYRDAFGFAAVGRRERSGPAFATLTGVSGGASVVVLRLGGQEIELVQFAEPGRPYPAVRASNDPWFQHMAIVVSDMRAAYARLSAVGGWTPITRGGPQRLPANTGGVTAFKFRDPEGHPLELLEFAAEAVPAQWRGRGSGPCLGIDHSAIVVDDSAQSISFYGGLGFAVAGGSLNRGVEQARLDDLTAPVVDVTPLAPRATEPPRLELLHYRAPPSGEPSVLRGNDVAATRLVIAVDGSPPDLGDARAALRRDPDGHHLLLLGENADGW